jgi:transcriptional regulator with XRE-family HTH domain
VRPGPTSRHVVENVARLRGARGLTREALSERLTEVGRPIRATGLARLEAGRRRVDADDLVALALALDVSPVRLLMPADQVDTVELTDSRKVAWQAAWRWAVGEEPATDERMPLHDRRVAAFIAESRPFEMSPVTEAARMLNARVPAPWVATISKPRTDAPPKGKLTIGDDADDEV